MSSSHPSRSGVKRIADAVASATEWDAALDRLTTELSRALNTRACIFHRGERGWTLVSQSRGGMRLAISDLLFALNNVPSDDPVVAVNLGAVGAGTWTSMALEIPDGPWVVLLAGDWANLPAFNTLSVLVSFVLRSVRERELRRREERLSIGGYAMNRRLSRLGSLETVCEQIVRQVAQSLQAERVTLGLYRPDEDRIAVVAKHGASAVPLGEVRIAPGAWVMGHVYASGRPVLVPDVRQLPQRPREESTYRTFSFAAVPMMVSAETIGVLSATDKRDGSAFCEQDVRALRSFSAAAALGIKAAASDTEAHRLAHVATVDALTKLFNRPYLDTRLYQEIERAKRGSSSLTLLLADIDDFKTINDTHGHQVGDAVLQAVGATLRSAVRVFDVCARYGGDEFGILMPSSDQSSAVACAERIRHRVAEYDPGNHGPADLPRVTMSIGVARFESGDTSEDLIRRADQCLYEAKAAGKNCVRLSAVQTNVHRLPPARPSPNEPS